MSVKRTVPLVEKIAAHTRRLVKKRIFVLAVCIFLAVAAIVISLVARFEGASDASSAESVARAALDAYLEFDSDEMLSLFHEKYVNFAADKYYGSSQKGFENLLKSNAEKNRKEFVSRYGNWSYSDVKVKSSREYSSRELSALNENFEALGIGLKARAACTLKLEYTLSYISSADMRLTEKRTYEAFVVRIGSHWYLFDK